MVRYIDADKMKNEIMEYVNKYGKIVGLSITKFNIMLERSSADVRENVRGEWAIEDCHAATYKYCCSNCKAHHRAMYDFCPSCGADMRERSTDETD